MIKDKNHHTQPFSHIVTFNQFFLQNLITPQSGGLTFGRQEAGIFSSQPEINSGPLSMASNFWATNVAATLHPSRFRRANREKLFKCGTQLFLISRAHANHQRNASQPHLQPKEETGNYFSDRK